MLRTAYVSQVARSFGEAELDDVLVKAIQNNKRDDVTGMMICHGQSLFQVLEGPEENVGACYNRIVRDTRHWGIERVYWRRVETRAFSDWSMGLAAPSTFRPSVELKLHSFAEITARLEAVNDLDISYGKRRLISTMGDFMARVGLNTAA